MKTLGKKNTIIEWDNIEVIVLWSMEYISETCSPNFLNSEYVYIYIYIYIYVCLCVCVCVCVCGIKPKPVIVK